MDAKALACIMCGSQTKRQQQKTEKKRELSFFFIGLAIGLGSWGYPVLSPEPSVYVGSALVLIAQSFLIYGLWNVLGGGFKKAVIVILLVAFVLVDYRLIKQSISPSFVFVVPGVWVNGDTWDFIVKHRGPKTVYNAKLTFTDEDRIRAFSQHPQDAMYVQLDFPEINPHKSGVAKQFLWKPLIQDDEHYSVIIESRNTNFFQILEIKMVDGKWVWATRITDLNRDHKLILECKDSTFPPDDKWDTNLIFTRKTGQEVKHLVMKQFMEVRDVHDQEVLY